MNQALICSVLFGLGASFAICQETTDSSAPAEATQTRFPLIRSFLKSSPSDELVPLSRQERFRLYLNHTYGPGSAVSAATVGGFEQLMNTPSEWKQGMEGYRKRFESAYATHIVQGTLEYGASSLLHEDNRYRRSLETGVWRRSRHAIIGAFTSTDEAGHQHFSSSSVGAAVATAFIRRTWQPSSTAGVGDAGASFGLIVTGHVAGNMFREFWPTIQAHLFNKKR